MEFPREKRKEITLIPGTNIISATFGF